MIKEIEQDSNDRMGKSLASLQTNLARLRTGRANPSLLDGIEIDYYGTPTPLNQAASITVEDARTLAISPWEKNLVPVIEKAILKSELGVTPAATSELVRLPLPPLTEENRKDLARQAKQEGESTKVAIRNIRRDAIADIRELLKEKEVAEDEARRGEDQVQKITDARVAEVDKVVQQKEADLLEI